MVNRIGAVAGILNAITASFLYVEDLTVRA
jgi:hypothetical protein